MLSLASFSSVMVDLHSSREAGSAQGPPSATERRECKSRVTLLLRDADSGQIDHMAAEPTHGPHHPCSSSSWLGAGGPCLPIANVSLAGGMLIPVEEPPDSSLTESNRVSYCV